MSTAAILFALAALGGVVMALMRFSGRDYPPMWLAIVHGLAAAAGLVALILVVLGPAAAGSVTLPLVLFIAAALLGFFLFSYHLRGRPLPIPTMVVHAIIAVIAFVILLVAILGRT